MEFTKVKNYVDQIDNLIRQECTGTADEFAKKLGVSERTLQNHLQQLRLIGINIVYNHTKRTYCYREKGSMTFGFTSSWI
jgi:predicted DNA-binding transcriptional regulator YafY